MSLEEERAARLAKLKQSLVVGDKNAPADPAPAPPSAEPGLPVPLEGPASAPGARSGVGLLDLLASFFKPKPPPEEGERAKSAVRAEAPAFTVLVASLNNDPDGSAAMHVFKALEGRPGLKLKPYLKAFQLESLEDPIQTVAAQVNTRHAVAEEMADLLVWGDAVKDGVVLRLSSAVADDERFGLTTRAELPKAFPEMAANLLYAGVLAAIDPASEALRATHRRLLAQAATAAEPLALKTPIQFTMPQQRSVQLLFGHVALVNAQLLPPDQALPWFDRAANAYRAAEKRVGRTDPEWEAALIHRHLAAALTAKAERDKAPVPLLEEAVKSWRIAAERIAKAVMPQEWANTQIRLGTALYRLDLLTGDTDLLREAIGVLQAALQIYSKSETPQRWAEIMNTIAQVLEVYGDQLRNTEVLRRAIDACHSVLELRTRDRTPLAWAATQNTLGSALFLLDKHSEGSTTHLDDAAQALSEALEVFQAHGAKGPAQVAAKNLAHVRKLQESRRGRQIISPHWADE